MADEHGCVTRITDRLLQNPLAVWSPCVLATSFLSLISVTRLIAIAQGHVEDQIFPTVSPATRLAPEYWVWTFGVALTLIFAMVPMSLLVYRALLPPREDAENWEMPGCFCGCCLPPAMLVAYSVACVFLMGLAAIPLQENIYEIRDPTQYTIRSIVHLTCAAVFFGTMNVTAFVVIVWQWVARCCCGSDPRCGKRIGGCSLAAKTAITACIPFAASIGPPLAYAYLLVFYGREFADDEIDNNSNGASQRTLIALTVFFAASFTFEIKAMQQELSGSDARTPIVGAPVELQPAGGGALGGLGSAS